MMCNDGASHSDNKNVGWQQEMKGIVLLSLSMFLLLITYYVLKTVREALILTQGGAEVKSYSAFAQALVLLVVVPAYSALASRVKRVTLLSWITSMFATNLLLFFVMDRAGLRIGVTFFIWLGIFSVMLLSQFWAFANDLYSQEQGKRIFPMLGLAGAIGAFGGAEVARRIFIILSIGQIMLLASALLIVFIGLIRAMDRYAKTTSPIQAAIAEQPIIGAGSFNLVLNNRYLLLVALLIVLANLVNATGEFMLGKMAIQTTNQMLAGHMSSPETRRQLIGAFYGSYFARANFVGLILQGLLVSRILQWLGVSRSLFVSRWISIFGYASLAVVPGLGLAQVAKIAENSVDYTLEKTALQTLFLRFGRAEKYKAKTAIDTFFYRAGDLLQALVVVAGTNLAFTIQQYALMNMACAIVSLFVVVAINREHRALGDARYCETLGQTFVVARNIGQQGQPAHVGLATSR
jgi:AAA family ATP:ADP antiporter